MNKLKIYIAVCLVASLLVGGSAHAKQWKNRAPAGLPPLTETGEVVGTPQHPQEAHKTFRLVRYRGRQRWGSPLSAGSVVVWHTGALSGDGVTVTDAAFSDDTRIAGITVTGIKTAGAGKVSTVVHQYRSLNVTSDIRNYGSWGWLQTFGKARTRCSMKLTRDNSAFGAATNRGMGAKYSMESVIYGSLIQIPSQLGNGGFWMTLGGGTSGSTDVFLRCE